MIKIVLPGTPIRKKSTRFFFRRGKGGGQNTQKGEMNVLKWQIKSQHPGPPLEGIVSVITFLYFPFPARISKKKKQQLATERVFSQKKIDNDNCEKIYFDCLKNAIFTDDSLIVQNFTVKIYSEEPRVEFYIKQISDYAPTPNEIVNLLYGTTDENI